MCLALPHQQIRSCDKARRLLKIPDFGKTRPRITWRLLARQWQVDCMLWLGNATLNLTLISIAKRMS